MRILERAAIVACFVLGSCQRETSSIKLEPNAKFTLECPGLPATFFEQKTGKQTVPLLSAQLPENYAADKTFPLFVFIDGGNGGPSGNASFARRIIGPRDFIAVNLPLFKDAKAKAPTLPGVSFNLGDVINSNDVTVLGSSYRVMLEKLAQTIPNIARERSTMGGFSNGAHATSVLVTARDEFILKQFTAFVLLEGGIGLLLNPAVISRYRDQGTSFHITVRGSGQRSQAAGTDARYFSAR